MSNVFISYSRQNQDFTRRIFTALEERGVTTWVDWQGIEHSTAWWDTIKRGIDGTSAFIFLISNASLSSPVCTLEMAHAIENGKRIVPVLIEESNFNIEVPLRPADDLFNLMLGKRSLAELIRIQRQHLQSLDWVNFIDVGTEARSFEVALSELIETVNTDLQHNAQHARLLTQARRWQEQNRNNDLLLFGDEITAAEIWLDEADISAKAPKPVQVQREYVHQSRIVHTQRVRTLRRSQIAAAITAIAALILMLVAAWAARAADSANERVQRAEATLTRVPDTLTPAALALVDSEEQRDQAIMQVTQARATVVEILPTVTEAAAIIGAAEAQKEIAAVFADAMLKVNQGDQAGALQLMDDLVGRYPKNALVYHERGLLHAILQLFDEAIADYARAIELDPQASSYTNLAYIYMNRGEYETSIGEFTEAINLDSDYVSALNGRGLAFANLGDYDSAIADFTRVIEEASPNSAFLYYGYTNRGNAYVALGHYETAIADFTQAIEQNTGDPAAYFYRGNAYGSMENSEAANDDWSLGMQLISTLPTPTPFSFFEEPEYVHVFPPFPVPAYLLMPTSTVVMTPSQ